MKPNLKTEYVATDNTRFTEEKKDLAEKYQHKLDLLDMVKKYSKDYIEIIRASNTYTELKNSLITLIQVISD